MNSTTIFEYIQKLEKENEELRKKPSLFETTARTKTHALNQEIAEHLKELGDMTSDFYKAAAYNTAADVIAALDFEVQTGESLREIKGIGKGISSKVDQFLDEYFEDSESVASTEGQILDESADESGDESVDESADESGDETDDESDDESVDESADESGDESNGESDPP